MRSRVGVTKGPSLVCAQGPAVSSALCPLTNLLLLVTLMIVTVVKVNVFNDLLYLEWKYETDVSSCV